MAADGEKPMAIDSRASLRDLRFHDLRHTFGTRMIAKADVRRVQEWMGHADIQTTMKYLHYAPRAEDARLVAEAFAVSTGAGPSWDISGRLGTNGDVSGQTESSVDAAGHHERDL